MSNDLGWIQLHMPGDGSVEIEDQTESLCCLGLWGPESRPVLGSVCGRDLSNAAFAYMTGQSIKINTISVWARRVGYVGELGWELYIQPQEAVAVWDALMEAGGNLYGGESVYAGGKVVDRIRSGSYGYSIGKDIGLVYLPLELVEAAVEFEVQVMGERVRAKVANIPLVDSAR